MDPRDWQLWFDRDGEPIDIETWTRLHADPDYKILAQDQTGPYLVSTVWLGLDHRFLGDGPPVIFETMVFATTDELVEEMGTIGPDLEQRRYCTEAEALAGHAETVLLVRATSQDLPE